MSRLTEEEGGKGINLATTIIVKLVKNCSIDLTVVNERGEVIHPFRDSLRPVDVIGYSFVLYLFHSSKILQFFV